MNIDQALVRRLLKAQFPKWSCLPVRPVASSGWDNRTFHLGDEMTVRLPSAECYAGQIEKEYTLLPRLAPHLPLAISCPLAVGRPEFGYPWKWGIYKWQQGVTVASSVGIDRTLLAKDLARWLRSLHGVDASTGPAADAHSFYRGGSLSCYESQTRQAIEILGNQIDQARALMVWEQATATSWQPAPVWVHGDISPGNLLVRKGRLAVVIDFGQLAVGDPACDLAIAWTFFEGESHQQFQNALRLDGDTWLRGRAWALWKALVVAAGVIDAPVDQKESCFQVFRELLDG